MVRKQALVFAAIGLVVVVSASAAVQAPPTVRECAQLQLKAKIFTGSRLATTVFCLRPDALKTSATMTWTTCPTTPKGEGESCAQGAISIAFRSTGSGFAGGGPDSWGGENLPGAGIFALPGTGTYSCKAAAVDKDSGLKYAPYSTSVRVRDQAVGFAAVGKRIKVGWSIHPGFRGPLGHNAEVKLGQPNTCVVGLASGVLTLRAAWPGRVFSVASVQGARTTVSSSGMATRSFPVPPGEGLLPGVRIQETVRWKSSAVIIPALKRY